VDGLEQHPAARDHAHFRLAAGSSTVLPFNYKDTWRASGGVNYRYGEKWVFRAGVAWDQTPVNEGT
jgi:long-subunit fatty acid transport protein